MSFDPLGVYSRVDFFKAQPEYADIPESEWDAARELSDSRCWYLGGYVYPTTDQIDEAILEGIDEYRKKQKQTV